MANLQNVAKMVADLGVVAEVKEVTKNGENKLALIPTGMSVSPVFYEDRFLDSTDEDMVSIVMRNISNTPSRDELVLDDLSKAILCIRKPVEDNAMTTPFLDLQLYVRIKVGDFLDGSATYVVNNGMEKMLGHTKEEIFEIARANACYSCKSMLNFINMSMPYYDDEDKEFITELMGNSPLMVCSNKEKLYGASAISDTELLHELGKDKYILPSSIHEVLVVDTEYASVDELKDMVESINNKDVAPEEILSYSVYKYDYEKNEVSIVG